MDNLAFLSARKNQLLNFENCYYIIPTNCDYQAYLYPTLTENLHLTAAPSLSLTHSKNMDVKAGTALSLGIVTTTAAPVLISFLIVSVTTVNAFA